MTAARIEVAHFRNVYDCEECGEGWADEWCCACNDRCPGCDAETAPADSEELEAFTLRPGVDVCGVSGSTHAF